MAEYHSITAETAELICRRLNDVASMQRAMRTLAMKAEDDEDYYAVAAVVEGLSERCHQVLDSCITKMGGFRLGNFDDAEWGEAEAEGGAA